MKRIKFVKKIGVKIIGAMVLCSLIMGLLISSISIFTNFHFFRKEINEKLLLLPQNYSNQFNSDFKIIQSSVNTLGQYISATFDLEKFHMDPKIYVEQYEKTTDSIIKRVAEEINKEEGIYRTNGVEAVYVTFNPQLTGDVHEIWYADLDRNGRLKKKDSDPNGSYIEWFYPDNPNMLWYYNPIEKRKGVWSDPYDEVDLNRKIISYTEPVFKDDVLVAVVGMDITIDALKNTIKNMKVYDTGYAFLMDEHYDFLIHPTFKNEENLKMVQNGRLKFIAEKMGKKNAGIINYKFKGADKILGYTHLSNGWILGFVVPINEVYASLIKQIFMTFMAILISICIIIVIALYVGKSISDPIVKLTQIIKNIGAFNFVNDHAIEMLMENRDEIGIMAKEMSHMGKILKETGIDKAAILQRQSLQKEFPLPCKLHVKTIYVPAKTVSGDFFNMYKVNEDLVIGIIADVSGKGVTAALNTSAFHVLFHEAVLRNENPADILHDLNIQVANFLGEMYIAACCFSFDFKRNEGKVVGAGINQFIFQKRKDNIEERIVIGPFLGMFENSIFDEQKISFQSGDKFYFYTDGLEFFFNDDKNKENYLKPATITDFKNYLNNLLTERLTDIEGLKDDCTLIALEIK